MPIIQFKSHAAPATEKLKEILVAFGVQHTTELSSSGSVTTISAQCSQGLGAAIRAAWLEEMKVQIFEEWEPEKFPPTIPGTYRGRASMVADPILGEYIIVAKDAPHLSRILQLISRVVNNDPKNTWM